MSSLQIFAFVVLPAALLLAAYFIVVVHERKGRNIKSESHFWFFEGLLEIPFQMPRDNITKTLAFAFYAAFGAYVASALTPEAPNWLLAVVGMIFSAILVFSKAHNINRMT
jgi:hypothetical protein